METIPKCRRPAVRSGSGSILLAIGFMLLAGPLWGQDGEWVEKSPMPTPREKLASCVIGQYIQVVGGASGANQVGLGTNERYDTVADSWSQDAPMITGRRSLTASAVDGICYAIGGRRNLGDLIYDAVEAFDPSSGQWSTRAPMPTPRFYLASAAFGGTIYVVGGSADAATASGVFEAYTPATNSWQTLPDLPTPRLLLAAVSLEGKLYVLGGTMNPGSQFYSTMEVYDPGSGTWTQRAPMPTARAGLAAVAAGGKIYAIGGSPTVLSTATVEVYDPATDQWTAGVPISAARTKLTAATVGDSIFVIGGSLQLAPPHNGLDRNESMFVGESPEAFQINFGLNDAWFNPATAGQGFFITVFPDIRQLFLAWFTYDTERPAGGVEAVLGEPGHRWLTAFGPYADDSASLDIEVTSGGVFDSTEPVPSQETDGEILLEFSDCENGMVSYDIASLELQGDIPIQRIALDNVLRCEALEAR